MSVVVHLYMTSKFRFKNEQNSKPKITVSRCRHVEDYLQVFNFELQALHSSYSLLLQASIKVIKLNTVPTNYTNTTHHSLLDYMPLVAKTTSFSFVYFVL